MTKPSLEPGEPPSVSAGGTGGATGWRKAFESFTLNRRRRIVQALGFLPPALLLAWFAVQFGHLQNNDYFGSIARALAADSDSWVERTHQLLTTRSNEHRIGLPMLVYRANLALFSGDNRSLVLLVLSMMAMVATLQLLLAEPLLQSRSLGRRWIATLSVSAFAFTPVAAHNVAMAFSGTMWFMSNCFFVVGLLVLVRGTNQRRRAATLLVVLCGFAALFSYSTSLAYWPAVLIAAVMLRWSVTRLLVLSAAAVASYAYYAATYSFQAAEPNTTDVPRLIKFFAAYLGSLFTADVDRAAVFGGAGLLAAAMCIALCLRRRADPAPLAPWSAMQIFCIFNAAGTAVGRSSMTEGASLASRYATLPAFFWIGLFFVVMQCTGDPAQRKRQSLFWLVAAAYACLIVLMAARGIDRLSAFTVRADMQKVSEIALLEGIYDERILRSVSAAPHQIWEVREDLVRLEHVPFDRPRHTRPLGWQIEASAIRPCPNVRGRVIGRNRLPDGNLYIFGRAFVDEQERVDEVLVLGPSNDLVGRLALGQPTPAHRNALWRSAPKDLGWAGYVIDRPDLAVRDLVLVARVGESDHWCRFDVRSRQR